MHWYRRTALVAVSAAAAVATAVILPSAAEAAIVARVQLPFVDAADVAAAGDLVFVSGGADSTEIAVVDPASGVVGTISGLPGPADLLTSDDQRTLYVALPNVNAIAAFDVATGSETARYATGKGECPSSLALSGQYLWFGYGCDQWGGNIGRIDLSAQPATVTTGLSGQDYYEYPLLATASHNEAILLATQPFLSPTSAHVYSIGSDGTLTFVREDAHNLGSNLRDAALDPAGERAYLAAGAPYRIEEYAVTDLTVRARSFPTGSYPNAVEPSGSGRYLAAGVDGLYDPDVYFYTAEGVKLGEVELGQGLIDRGLVWAPGDESLYAVSADPNASAPKPATLHVLTIPKV